MLRIIPDLNMWVALGIWFPALLLIPALYRLWRQKGSNYLLALLWLVATIPLGLAALGSCFAYIYFSQQVLGVWGFGFGYAAFFLCSGGVFWIGYMTAFKHQRVIAY